LGQQPPERLHHLVGDLLHDLNVNPHDDDLNDDLPGYADPGTPTTHAATPQRRHRPDSGYLRTADQVVLALCLPRNVIRAAGGVLVLVQHATEAVTSADVQVAESGRIGDRVRQRCEWSMGVVHI
jgi:hypothetical protein